MLIDLKIASVFDNLKKTSAFRMTSIFIKHRMMMCQGKERNQFPKNIHICNINGEQNLSITSGRECVLEFRKIQMYRRRSHNSLYAHDCINGFFPIPWFGFIYLITLWAIHCLVIRVGVFFSLHFIRFTFTSYSITQLLKQLISLKL